VSAATEAARTIRVLTRSGALRFPGPVPFVRGLVAARRWGRGLGGAVAANAAREPNRICLIDELGALTHAELHDRSSRLAAALAARGVRPKSAVGLLCRDHRHFIEGAVAVNKLGADLLLLNTSFSGPQLREVLDREQTRAIIYDEEFESLLEGAPADVVRVIGWHETPGPHTIDALIASASAADVAPPAELGRTVLLTSGTTGTPKGARRAPEAPTSAVVDVLERIPVRHGERHFVVAPMFHAWGFAHMGLGILLGCEIVLRRRFDAEATLAAISRHQVQSAAMVPVMAQRILELGPEVHARYDTSSLRLVALGGSAIPGDLAVRFMNAFGDCVYNTYGSTEVAVVSIAGPDDLRADPTTAGRPVGSIVVRLLDAEGREVPSGQPGRIFVGSEAAFEGYTGGGSKEAIDGLMSTGDVGSFDGAGRLRIEGRDDDMIVSGGENVYPGEVEDVINRMEGVSEAAVIGVEDDEFGQRLCAYVVRLDGAELDADAVRSAVKSQLARYKVPRDVVFVDELPRTATGKVLKRALSE
jgi:acyl-CoA synthetase (AMP-forming)/AMP-acid ligase II